MAMQVNAIASNSIESYSDDKSNSMKEEQHQHLLARKPVSFSSKKPATPILDTVNYPIHMKNLSVQVSKQS